MTRLSTFTDRLTFLAFGALFAMTLNPATDAFAADPASALDFEMTSLAGDKVDLESYKGKSCDGGQHREPLRRNAPVRPTAVAL